MYPILQQDQRTEYGTYNTHTHTHLILMKLQILLVHCGEEHTVNAAYIDNRLGNPLLLRRYIINYSNDFSSINTINRALDCGVKVITAHCATEVCCHSN